MRPIRIERSLAHDNNKINDQHTMGDDNDDHDAPRRESANDFVIRDGFPALRLPRQKEEKKTKMIDKSEAEGIDSSDADNKDTAEITSPWIEGEEPLPKFDFWGQDQCFEFDNEERLWQDCRTVFSARTRNEDAAYSAGETYFLPCQMKPRCALEAMVQKIFQAHTQSLEEGVMIPEQSGAEWWTLVLDTDKEKESGQPVADTTKKRDSSEKDDDEEEEEEEADEDEVGMHLDADYGLEDQSPNLLLHPRVATVTYLTNRGAPTVVLDRRSPPMQDVQKTSLQGSVSKVWISHPQVGKHIAFDGRLLHGAPATFFPPMAMSQPEEDGSDRQSKRPKTVTCSQRITLLVNIWVNHCPLDAEILDDEICDKLCPVSDPTTQSIEDKRLYFKWTWTQPNVSALPELTRLHLEPSKDDPAGEEEVVICNRLVSIMYNVNMEELHRSTRSGELLLLDLAMDALSINVGEEVKDDEDENQQEQDTDGGDED